MTEAERILWKKLKNKQLGERFLRQNPFFVYTEDNGFDRYIIPDFYCPIKELIIEVDGSIHDNYDVFILDQEKEKLIQEKGTRIMRITNEEVCSDLDNVIQKIKQKLQS